MKNSLLVMAAFAINGCTSYADQSFELWRATCSTPVVLSATPARKDGTPSVFTATCNQRTEDSRQYFAEIVAQD